jgi:hypothetical protein
MAIMKLGDAGDEPLRRRDTDAMPLNAAGKIDKKALRAERTPPAVSRPRYPIPVVEFFQSICDVSARLVCVTLRVQPRSRNAADECLADIHGVSLTGAWRGEEPLSTRWQRLHVLRKELREIG